MGAGGGGGGRGNGEDKSHDRLTPETHVPEPAAPEPETPVEQPTEATPVTPQEPVAEVSQAEAEAELLRKFDAEEARILGFISELSFNQKEFDVLDAEFHELGGRHMQAGLDSEVVAKADVQALAAKTSFSDAIAARNDPENAGSAERILEEARVFLRTAFKLYFDEIRKAHRTE